MVCLKLFKRVDLKRSHHRKTKEQKRFFLFVSIGLAKKFVFFPSDVMINPNELFFGRSNIRGDGCS